MIVNQRYEEKRNKLLWWNIYILLFKKNIEIFVEDTFDNKNWLKTYKEMIRQDLKQKEIFVIEMNAEML